MEGINELIEMQVNESYYFQLTPLFNKLLIIVHSLEIHDFPLSADTAEQNINHIIDNCNQPREHTSE